MSGAELVAIFGAFGVLLGGFYAFTAKQTKEAREERQQERKDFALLLQANTKSSERVAEETKLSRKAQEKGFEQAEERNGHLGEQNVQITRLITENSKDLMKLAQSLAEKEVMEQHVHQQTVEHQDVKE